jgi:hypothetical protein
MSADPTNAVFAQEPSEAKMHFGNTASKIMPTKVMLRYFAIFSKVIDDSTSGDRVTMSFVFFSFLR